MPSHRRDWKQYNKQLINRGNLNLWVTKKTLKFWLAKKKKKAGRPFTYSDAAIEAMVIVRFKYQLPLREMEGLFHSLGQWLSIPKIPSYTQVCRRMQSILLPKSLVNKSSVTDLVMDTTGLKVYGEGQWCAKKYGGKSKWVKLHIALDLKSGKLVFAEASDEYTHDTAYLKKALSKCNQRKGTVLFDGIADSRKSYEKCQDHNKQLLTPPNKKAVIRKELIYEKRNDAIRAIKGLGGDEIARSIWAKLTGYSQRSVVEAAISKWKRLMGPQLRSNEPERIKKEVAIKAMIFNQLVNS